MNFQIVLVVVLGYLLGSLPFAVIVSRAFDLPDPRTVGSKNPGATNVLRSGNKLAALLTLAGDALKGWVAMLAARAFGVDELGAVLAGITAFLGHVFPLFLGFKGGKGVATALGVLAGIDGRLAAFCGGLWLATALAFRYSSLAALVAATGAPLIGWWLGLPFGVVTALALMSALLIFRHRSNIANLLAGTEGKLGAKKPS